MVFNHFIPLLPVLSLFHELSKTGFQLSVYYTVHTLLHNTYIKVRKKMATALVILLSLPAMRGSMPYLPLMCNFFACILIWTPLHLWHFPYILSNLKSI